MIGISACLGGMACRYDGGSQTIAELVHLVENGKAVMICPEVAGGLPIPRKPAEIVGGDGLDVWLGSAKVLDNSGFDVTDIYQAGAKQAYHQLVDKQVTTLILKEKSPSCGVQQIYDGAFSGHKIAGVGVATAYFRNQGIVVYADTEWETVKSSLSKEGIL
ncbi:DUF523 domain-containing protein [Vagococcus sp. BWB3-3]|uniref:DUF523 domain-containing protein n=1 Tax=Vagococcus allomyrinae TaxID=2794353 RepID=A0A940SZI7_9ENTE|nr:DUF523 domain-containing protein [Vagococcus allomyrinae]MBP1044473.1 DUF523 domain-containing protein [Vagococcus allomyrinae]